MDPYIKLAKQTIKEYLKSEKIISPPNNLPQKMLNQKAGVFVCLKNNKQLKGCIGTFAPTKNNIAQEIISNAVASATRDPRFEPLKIGGLNNINVSVDILSAPQKTSKEELDPKKYGVIVKSNSKSGLLLPNLEGVDTTEEQLSIACQKAGINYLTENFDIYKFSVERHEE